MMYSMFDDDSFKKVIKELTIQKAKIKGNGAKRTYFSVYWERVNSLSHTEASHFSPRTTLSLKSLQKPDKAIERLILLLIHLTPIIPQWER